MTTSVPSLWHSHRHSRKHQGGGDLEPWTPHLELALHHMHWWACCPLLQSLPSLWDWNAPTMGHEQAAAQVSKFRTGIHGWSYLLVQWFYLWVYPEGGSRMAGSWVVHSSSACAGHTMRNRACQHRYTNQAYKWRLWPLNRDSMQEGTLRIFRKIFMAIANKQERCEETEGSMQTFRSLRQEDSASKASLGYRVSSRAAWANKWIPVSKSKRSGWAVRWLRQKNACHIKWISESRCHMKSWA